VKYDLIIFNLTTCKIELIYKVSEILNDKFGICILEGDNAEAKDKVKFDESKLLEPTWKSEILRSMRFTFESSVNPGLIKDSNQKSQIYKMSVNENENIIMFSHPIGIIWVDIFKQEIIRITGIKEFSERFVGCALFQGKEHRNTKTRPNKSGNSSQHKIFDPVLFCWSFAKNRFFMFSQREPYMEENIKKGNQPRDEQNEVIIKNEIEVVSKNIKVQKSAKKILISTSMGDIFMYLFKKVNLIRPPKQL
jgi:hypothetical protein